MQRASLEVRFLEGDGELAVDVLEGEHDVRGGLLTSVFSYGDMEVNWQCLELMDDWCNDTAPELALPR